jgi:hypothetical protein
MNSNVEKKINQEKDLLTIVRNLNLPRRKALNYLVSHSIEHDFIFPSQKTIAHEAGVTRKTCNYILKELESKGLIRKEYRHRKSCVYKVNSLLFDPTIRSALATVFKAFKFLQISLLLSIVPFQKCLSEYAPALNYKAIRNDYYIKKTPHRMNMDKYLDIQNPISGAIRNLKFLNLTRWGQIKLSAFPEDILNEVKDEYLKYSMNNIRDPFKYFFVSCLKLCKERNIKPDWSWVHQLSAHHQMPQNPRYTFPSQTKVKLLGSNEQKPVSSKKAESKSNGSPNLYPVYEPKEYHQEDDQKRQETVRNWIGTQEAQTFLGLVGPSVFEEFVRNRLKGP